MLDCALGEIVAAPNKRVTIINFNLHAMYYAFLEKGGKSLRLQFVRKLAIPHMILGQSDVPSTITIVVEEISEKEGKDVVGFRLSCTNLINRGVLSKHDPYLIISKQLEDGSWTVVHKTEVLEVFFSMSNICIFNASESKCKMHLHILEYKKSKLEILLSANVLIGGKTREYSFKMECFILESSWSSKTCGGIPHNIPTSNARCVHRYILRINVNRCLGHFDITLTFTKCITIYACSFTAFQDGKASFPLINLRKKEKNQSYTNSGLLQIQELRVDEKKTFVDYLQSGLQLQWTVVIDFSSHNKSLKSPTSYDSLFLLLKSTNI